MSTLYDAIVLGLGGMGSATLYNLSKNNLNVLGIEQFEPLHDKGSSHGETRIFRKAYFEGADYIPLLKRSEFLFQELEKLTATKLLDPCGLALYAKPTQNNLYQSAYENGSKHKIEIEILNEELAGKRFQNLNSGQMTCLYEPGAGYVKPEATIQTYLDLAAKRGVKVKTSEPVISIQELSYGVEVQTTKNKYLAQKLIETAGPWTAEILKPYSIPIRLKKMILYWFKINEQYDFSGENPCFGYELGSEFYYGFPSVDKKTIKMATHVAGDFIEKPEDKNTSDSTEHLKMMKEFVRTHLKNVTDEVEKSDSCIYSLTPDEHFIIDMLPGSQKIMIACGFSGHGFKFVPVIGEILSYWVLNKTLELNIDFLRLSRFKKPT